MEFSDIPRFLEAFENIMHKTVKCEKSLRDSRHIIEAIKNRIRESQIQKQELVILKKNIENFEINFLALGKKPLHICNGIFEAYDNLEEDVA